MLTTYNHLNHKELVFRPVEYGIPKITICACHREKTGNAQRKFPFLSRFMISCFQPS